jgi:hypothetical protein
LALKYLVPLKILFGDLPPAEVLEQHNLGNYVGIIAAVKDGNIRLFSDEIEKNEMYLIDQGVFLFIEKIRGLVMRNFVAKIFNSSREGESSVLKVSVLAKAFKDEA